MSNNIQYDRSVPKLLGGDFELGNFISGLESRNGTGAMASKALLRQVDGVPASSFGHSSYFGDGSSGYGYGWGSWYGAGATNPQDQGRRFLDTNGGSAYCDLDHAEFCLPEVRSAFDFAAAQGALLRCARDAQIDANAALPDGQRLQVLVNNSDGKGNSYGSHLNVMVSRAALDDILERRPHFLQFLATHQLSSMIYTGQGKVGSENQKPNVRYQISQRADFMETVIGEQTTYRRPIVNSRDETLCGKRGDIARLHVIFFDNTLCHGANVLKAGTMQIVLALIEAENVETTCLVDDLVGAAVAWSHDPSLRQRVGLVGGDSATALEVQQRLLDHALTHFEQHGFETVPRADEILALWSDTLAKLAADDLDALAGRIDWILKLRILERAIELDASLDWRSPELTVLDQIFGSLDPDEGLFWPHERSGLVEPWVSEAEIDHFTREPPSDTRAWARAMLLRRFAREEIESVNWDRITLRIQRDGRSERFELRLDDPLGFTAETTPEFFDDSEPQGENHANP